MPRRRHPKKDVETAVRAAEDAGWSVTEIHRGHRWGILVRPSGTDTVTLFSTPRDPATLGKRIREQVIKCPHRTS